MMPKPRVVDIDELRKLAASGVVDLDLAAHFKVHLKTIQRARAAFNIPPGSGPGCEYALRRAREASLAAAERSLPRGRGGDAEYARLMRGRSYGGTVIRRVVRISGALMA